MPSATLTLAALLLLAWLPAAVLAAENKLVVYPAPAGEKPSGDYTLEVLVVTQDGAEHHASRRVRVLKNVESTAAPAHTFSN